MAVELNPNAKTPKGFHPPGLLFSDRDRVYARSMQLHDEITPRIAAEGMRVFDAYAGLYLPVFLGKRLEG